MILKAPAATLEIVDDDHERMVDGLEVGRPLDHRVRIAVKVDELGEASRAMIGRGAESMAPLVEPPWGDRNQRFQNKGRHATHAVPVRVGVMATQRGRDR